jgi:hypothetical protein
MAWYDGTQGQDSLLMLANLLRLVVVFLAFFLFLWSVGLGTKERPPVQDQVSVLTSGCAIAVLLVCAGLPFLWPVALAIPVGVVTIEAVRRRQALLAPGWKPVLARAVLGGAVFLCTWYQAASTTRSALYGMGQRIDEVGPERLREWARQKIAEVPPGEQKGLRYDDVPDYVSDLMGNIPGWPFGWVNHGSQPYVFLANGSGYGYGVNIYPEDDEATGRSMGGMRWCPGIFIETVSK